MPPICSEPMRKALLNDGVEIFFVGGRLSRSYPYSFLTPIFSFPQLDSFIL